MRCRTSPTTTTLRRSIGEHPLPRPTVKHRLDVLPRVDDILRWAAKQLEVSAPRIKVGGVRLDVLVAGRDAVRVEDELVGGEEQPAVEALDALGAGRVVAGGHEGAAAAPGALVHHGEGKVVGQAGRCVVAQEGLAEALRFSPCYHSAAPRADRHRSGTAEDLQLNGGALDAGDAEGDAAVVNLVVAKLFEERV